MDEELTAFDLKFLSDCGIPVGQQTPDKGPLKEVQDEPDEAIDYYRRIVEGLG